jgi:patatin-like phospholipase/acyl hydrolase
MEKNKLNLYTLETSVMAKKFRILSIDGGGLRGIIPIVVLQELERRMGGKRIHEMFDMVAGTSTGGLIACAIILSDDGKTAKYDLNEVLSVYTVRGKEIFPQKNFLGKIVNAVTALKRPEFSASGLDKVLRDMVDHKRIMNCLLPLFVTSYDLLNNEAILFTSSDAASDPQLNAELYDICRATSAGPTYLPAYACNYGGKKRVFVDGGVFMNNPCVGALVEAIKFDSTNPYSQAHDIKDVCVLSLGTGHYTADLASKMMVSGGELDWAKPISDVMMQGVNATFAYEAQKILEPGQFLRISLEIGEEKFSNMADSSDQTRDYLLNEAKNQILNNSVLMNQLDAFIKTAGL